MTDKYKVTIKGPGINVDREIPESQASQLLVALLTGRTDISKGAGHVLKEAPVSDGNIHDIEADSITEYLGATSAKISPERIAAIAAFLKSKRNQSSFNRNDLEAGFLEAAESVPKNLHRDIKNAVKARWIAPKPGEKGIYYVTGTGVHAVNNRFQAGSVSRAATTTRKKS